MDGPDLLGNEGRKAIPACVKVSVFRNQKLREYTKTQALERLRSCCAHSSNIENLILSVLPEKDKNGKPKDTFNIFDIFNARNDLDKMVEMGSVEMYPEEDRLDSTKLTQEIFNQRQGVETEYKNCLKRVPILVEARPIADETDGGKKHLDDNAEKEYDKTDLDSSNNETVLHDDVECCFKEISPGNVNTLPVETASNNVSEFSSEYSEKETGFNGGLGQKNRAAVDQHGTTTERECEEATSDGEIDHGSGFIIGDNLVITCKHVLDDVIYDKTKELEVQISNAFIADLPCQVVYWDLRTDLALLYCSDLNIKLKGICPLEVSEHAPLPGISIFTFGYPFTYNGKTALFLPGSVSTTNYERYGDRSSLMVLNCSVVHGNSGGPVLCRAKGKVKVVGVITQKHKKDIFTIDQMSTILESLKSLKSDSIPDVNKVDFSWVNSLVTNLVNAFDTHCSFNLCNAIAGNLVTELVAKYQYHQKYGKEL